MISSKQDAFFLFFSQAIPGKDSKQGIRKEPFKSSSCMWRSTRFQIDPVKKNNPVSETDTW
jgi:hypothetical protein